MSKPVISVTVKLFAAYQEAFGKSEIVLQVPAGTSAAAIRDELIAQKPGLSQWRELTRFGVNFHFVEPDTILQSGDEIVLIPPVSGG